MALSAYIAPWSSARANARRDVKVQATADSEFDVVVIGAGIIGLTIANRLVRGTKLSVAVLEADSGTCKAGATGAGQGYIWNGHLNPLDEKWHFSRRSRQLWHDLAAEIQSSNLDPLSTIGWQETGSLLFTSSSEQSFALHERLHALAASGLQVEYCNAAAVKKLEPALCIPEEGAAGFVPGDVQIDAKLAVDHIQERNRSLAGPARYREFFSTRVSDFIWSFPESRMRGLKTSRGDIYSKKAIVLAAGSWSAGLMQLVSTRFDLPLVPPIKPRKGHLLVLENVPGMHLKHGLMEFGYSLKKESAAKSGSDDFGIAMTATMDPAGCVLLGSSRQFRGFDTAPEMIVVEQILENSAKFLPALANFSVSDARARTGLRPHITGGKPVIGPIPELPGLFLASGHEGEGLSLAWGTAEMVLDMVAGSTACPLNPAPYSPAGRLVRNVL